LKLKCVDWFFICILVCNNNYFELRFPTGKARACSLEALSIPSGVLLKIKCVNGNENNGVIRLTYTFIFILKGKWCVNIYFELRFPTGKARACGLETLSIPLGVSLKIKCVNGNGNDSVIGLIHTFILILIGKWCVDIYIELRFSTGKARACGLETLSIPLGVLLKIKDFVDRKKLSFMLK
jgi:hypothetical protein